MIATLSPVQTYALGFACPFCDAQPGALCTEPAVRARNGDPRPYRMHGARIKRAGRAAIEQVLARNLAPRLEERPGDCAACGHPWAAHVVEREGTRVRVTHPARAEAAE